MTILDLFCATDLLKCSVLYFCETIEMLICQVMQQLS